MNHVRNLGIVCVTSVACILAAACGAASEADESTASVVSEINPGQGAGGQGNPGQGTAGQGNPGQGAAGQGNPGQPNPGQCSLAQPKDVLIAGLVKDSWIAGFPLTRLNVDANGMIIGTGLPDLVAGDLDLINNVSDARTAVATAVRNIVGLPDYGIASIGPDTDACTGIPAWTPNGTTTVNTASNQVLTNGVNDDSWKTTQKEFGKVCPLVKRLGNHDLVDPPGDGSTNSPPSATVSATGVTANAFGICPSGSTQGTYCKLSYATGVNYTGRTCQLYYGSLRCLLY